VKLLHLQDLRSLRDVEELERVAEEGTAETAIA
jgi:hypothetical protein